MLNLLYGLLDCLQCSSELQNKKLCQSVNSISLAFVEILSIFYISLKSKYGKTLV
jgi:hypothetical protein